MRTNQAHSVTCSIVADTQKGFRLGVTNGRISALIGENAQAIASLQCISLLWLAMICRRAMRMMARGIMAAGEYTTCGYNDGHLWGQSGPSPFWRGSEIEEANYYKCHCARATHRHRR